MIPKFKTIVKNKATGELLKCKENAFDITFGDRPWFIKAYRFDRNTGKVDLLSPVKISILALEVVKCLWKQENYIANGGLIMSTPLISIICPYCGADLETNVTTFDCPECGMEIEIIKRVGDEEWEHTHFIMIPVTHG